MGGRRRATEIDPATRWPNAKRFARALTARPRSRRRWGIAALAVVLLVGIPAGATPRAVADSLFVRLLPPLWRELDREDSLPSDLLPASPR